jgi:hypothetical protein
MVSTSIPTTPTPSSVPILPPTTPTSAAREAAAKQVTVKSPRRTPSSSKLNIVPPGFNNNAAPPQISPTTNPRAAMKRSPSMPVMNNTATNKISDKQRQDMQVQLNMNKRTKSTDDVNLEKTVKKLSLAETRHVNKSQGDIAISPRKGIKKSVSMSAICMDNDKCK